MSDEKTVKKLIFEAKNKNKNALDQIIKYFKPLLLKNSVVDGHFNNDCYQDLVVQLIKCVYTFEL